MSEEIFGGRHITKSYGKKLVLDDAQVALPYRGIVGIFGLNGTGKTTLLRILSGIDREFKGELFHTEFSDVAYMTTEGGFPFAMRVKDAVEFYDTFTAGLKKEKIFQDAEEAGIRPKQSLGGLSSGMKQYLKFLLAVYSGARVCLFDEPLSNLDVNLRAKIARTMIMECGENRLFLITTHEIKEIETLIDGFLILKKGKFSPLYISEDVREETGKSIVEFYREKVNG